METKEEILRNTPKIRTRELYDEVWIIPNGIESDTQGFMDITIIGVYGKEKRREILGICEMVETNFPMISNGVCADIPSVIIDALYPTGIIKYIHSVEDGKFKVSEELSTMLITFVPDRKIGTEEKRVTMSDIEGFMDTFHSMIKKDKYIEQIQMKYKDGLSIVVGSDKHNKN